MMDKVDLQAAIRAAFEDVPYPGDDNIGDPKGDDDAERVIRWLRGKDWRDLNPINLWNFGLIFMIPVASHYYLPAYLLGMLEGNEQALTGVVLCFHPNNICPEDSLEATERSITIVSLMSLEQKQVLRNVLVHVLDKRINRLKKFQNELSVGINDHGDEWTEEDVVEEREYLSQRIEEIQDEINPMIEYWGNA